MPVCDACAGPAGALAAGALGALVGGGAGAVVATEEDEAGKVEVAAPGSGIAEPTGAGGTSRAGKPDEAAAPEDTIYDVRSKV